MPYLTRACCDMVSVSRLRVFRMLWEWGECRDLFRALHAARGVGNLEGGQAMCRGGGRRQGEWWRESGGGEDGWPREIASHLSASHLSSIRDFARREDGIALREGGPGVRCVLIDRGDL